jgi:hypothetical protein
MVELLFTRSAVAPESSRELNSLTVEPLAAETYAARVPDVLKWQE